MYDRLKEHVCKANLALVEHGLVVLTWGNVSQIDRQAGVVAIKPSGVDYDQLTADKIVIVDLSGRQIDGRLRPSSDTPTHLELYRGFPKIGGICHTHSRNATIWAQACKDIPCLGTTHADHFYGPIPCTPPMTPDQITGDYELNTGKVIVSRFVGLDPMHMPAVLVANHGPFTWGKDAFDAVMNAIVLEEVAAMALGVEQLSPCRPPIDQALLDRHFFRKHGSSAYYGQR
ncbi:MAG: L-ribulose-5-phosphate 4-epimerase [Sedimentisphaerales bacterium]|nr:L-ribulose-5-phosphate 4-epimerase [Sedimentisphaerales bacterium]